MLCVELEIQHKLRPMLLPPDAACFNASMLVMHMRSRVLLFFGCAVMMSSILSSSSLSLLLSARCRVFMLLFLAPLPLSSVWHHASTGFFNGEFMEIFLVFD
jgi:hypothetical protein